MNSIKNIGSSAFENAIEDGTQSFIYQRINKFTKPFLKEFSGDSAYDEAMTSFISTLSMGLALYAYTKVTSFFFTRSVKISGLLWSFIVAGAMKKKLVDKLKTSKIKGSKSFKLLGLVAGTDRTSERIEIAKMIQTNVDSYDKHKFHYQNQHDAQEKKIDRYANPIATFKANADMKAVTKFQDLTKRAKWNASKEHQLIYEKATGYKLSQTGEASWVKLYKDLNKYSEFFETANGEIANLTKAISKLVINKG